MIYSEVTGEGLPVVFLHGYGEDHTLWDNLAKSLEDNYKIVAIDLPGFGKSARLPGDFSIEDVADKVYHHLIKELQLKQFVLFGHSLGGYISLAIADRYKKEVTAFGLINSTALPDNPEKAENRIKTAEFIRKHSASFFLKSFVPNLFFEANRIQLQEEIEFVIAMGRDLNKNLLADYMLAMKDRPDRSNLLQEFENVLFVGGEKDSAFSINDYQKQITKLQKHENAFIMKDVGHMSMYEAPEELNAVISNFLKTL